MVDAIAVEHDREPDKAWTIFAIEYLLVTRVEQPFITERERERMADMGEGEKKEGSTFVRSQILNNIN